MRTLLLVWTVLAAGGCASMEHAAIVSPSQSIYHDATERYEAGNFAGAIVKYTEFLEAKPKSDLAVPAQLNLGMSYYYTGDFPQAYATLKAIDIKDENIKKYVDGVLEKCKAELPEPAPEEELASSAAGPETTGVDIQIVILDAYLDNFGDVVLKGRLNTQGLVIIDQKKIGLDADNTFTASASWKKGNPIIITAQDPNGRTEEMEFYPDGEPPLKPEGLRVINTSSNSIEIEWDENREDDLKGYRVFYRLRGDSDHEVRDIVKNNKFEVIGLAPMVSGANRTFEFYLRAVDKMDNESEDSDILEGILP